MDLKNGVAVAADFTVDEDGQHQIEIECRSELRVDQIWRLFNDGLVAKCEINEGNKLVSLATVPPVMGVSAFGASYGAVLCEFSGMPGRTYHVRVNVEKASQLLGAANPVLVVRLDPLLATKREAERDTFVFVGIVSGAATLLFWSYFVILFFRRRES